MALDIALIAPAARADYIRVGRHFGSDDTLAQANQTLAAAERYAAELAASGFVGEDIDNLRQWRDALVAAGVGRAAAQLKKKETSKAFAAALLGAKAARRVARSVLGIASARLATTGVEAGVEAARRVDAVIERTHTSKVNAERLAVQCDELAAILREPAVAAVAASRGAGAAAAELDKQAALLRASTAARTRVGGTPEATEQLDLLDGMIVELVREARLAARVAARVLGTPALAKEFELTRLYAVASHAKAPSDVPEPAA